MERVKRKIKAEDIKLSDEQILLGRAGTLKLFLPIKCQVMYDMAVNNKLGSELRVFMAILAHGLERSFPISHKFFKELGIDIMAARRALTKLNDAGIIKYTKNGNKHTIEYSHSKDSSDIPQPEKSNEEDVFQDQKKPISQDEVSVSDA